MEKAIGLIAGGGRLPLLFARAARARGERVVAVAQRDEVCPSLAAEVAEIHWFELGRLEGLLEALRRAGVRRTVILGTVSKTRFFDGTRPDAAAARLLAALPDRGDDTILAAAAAAIEARGIEIVDYLDYLADNLIAGGCLTSRRPTEREGDDLEIGLRVAKEAGKLGVGQTVVLKEGIILALEAIEGTDAAIERGGGLGGGGAVAVKAARPGQDLRFDVPVVGSATIEAMARAGVSCLGLEAGVTLIVDRAEAVRRADEAGIAIAGLSG